MGVDPTQPQAPLPPTNGYGRRPDRERGLVWPIILIVVGVIFLLNTLGLLPWSFWASVWSWWPLLLIFLGLEIVFFRGRRWGAPIAIVAFLVVAGVLAYVAPATGIRLVPIGQNGTWGLPGYHVTVDNPITSAMVRGSGTLVETVIDASNFSSIEVAGPFKVEIVNSPDYRATLTTDNNTADHVTTAVSGQRLKVQVNNVTPSSSEALKLRVEMPTLSGVVFSGATRGTVDGFESSGDVDLSISGASTLTGTLNIARPTIHTSGASRVTLLGSATDVRLEVSGASTTDLSGLSTRTADVDINGASRATVAASDALNGTVSGVSQLTYIGQPGRYGVTTSGGSSATQR